MNFLFFILSIFSLNTVWSATPSTLSTPIPTETVKVEEVVEKKPAVKRLMLGLDTENYKAMTSQNTTTAKQSYNGDIEAVQYLKVGYRLNDKTSVMAIPMWLQRMGYKEQSSNTTYLDLQLRATRSDIFRIGKMGFTTQGRVYLPTSTASNRANQLAQVRAYLIGSLPITGKLSFEGVINPRYYVYEKDNRGRGDNDWRALYNTALKYKLNDAIALETTLGIFSAKRVGDKDMAHFQDYSTSAYYTVSKNLTLNGGIRATPFTVDTDKGGFELYNHNVSEYYLIGSISL